MDNHKTAFVIGWPIKHSRSPLIHKHWLKEFGIQGDYIKIAVEPDKLAEFFQTVRSGETVGGNVTVPHKQAVLTHMDELHEPAQTLSAVNTVWNDNGKLHGTNTDGYGFLANLDDCAPGWDSKQNQKSGALVLGAGGASRAIIYSLQQRGFQSITIANRTLANAEEVANHFGTPCQACEIDKLPDHTKQVSLIVNTTSLGMGDGKSPLDLSPFDASTVVNDIVYVPLETPLLKQARNLGMRPVDGLGMLLQQAVPGFEKWFGVRPQVTDELRQLIIDDLGSEA